MKEYLLEKINDKYMNFTIEELEFISKDINIISKVYQVIIIEELNNMYGNS